MSDIDASNQTPISTTNQQPSNELDFSRLTHQNWLFINAFLATGSVTKSYKLAKYEGTEKSAPYQIFKKLKTYIEQIGDLDVTSRARLQADIKSVLDIPLEERKTLNLKEWLAVRKFSASITPEATKSKQQISVLVINRPSKEAPKGDNGGEKVINQPDISSENIIDIEPLS